MFDAELRQFDDDVANADFQISVVIDKEGKDSFDIGVANKSFTLEELERFFRFQKHKEFIVITYHKNAPRGELKESLMQLKTYFQEAGYKRILLTHGASNGVIIHEDFRPEVVKKSE